MFSNRLIFWKLRYISRAIWWVRIKYLIHIFLLGIGNMVGLIVFELLSSLKVYLLVFSAVVKKLLNGLYFRFDIVILFPERKILCSFYFQKIIHLDDFLLQSIRLCWIKAILGNIFYRANLLIHLRQLDFNVNFYQEKNLKIIQF